MILNRGYIRKMIEEEVRKQLKLTGLEDLKVKQARLMTAEDIKATRVAIGWSRSELAAYMGTSNDLVCRWENNKVTPSRKHSMRLKRLAHRALTNEIYEYNETEALNQPTAKEHDLALKHKRLGDLVNEDPAREAEQARVRSKIARDKAIAFNKKNKTEKKS